MILGCASVFNWLDGRCAIFFHQLIVPELFYFHINKACDIHRCVLVVHYLIHRIGTSNTFIYIYAPQPFPHDLVKT